MYQKPEDVISQNEYLITKAGNFLPYTMSGQKQTRSIFTTTVQVMPVGTSSSAILKALIKHQKRHRLTPDVLHKTGERSSLVKYSTIQFTTRLWQLVSDRTVTSSIELLNFTSHLTQNILIIPRLSLIHI